MRIPCRAKRKDLFFSRFRLLHEHHDCISQALKLWCVRNGVSRFQPPMYCLDGGQGCSRLFNTAWHTAFSSLFNTARRLFRPAARGPQECSHRARPVLTLQSEVFELNGNARSKHIRRITAEGSKTLKSEVHVASCVTSSGSSRRGFARSRTGFGSSRAQSQLSNLSNQLSK